MVMPKSEAAEGSGVDMLAIPGDLTLTELLELFAALPWNTLILPVRLKQKETGEEIIIELTLRRFSPEGQP